MIAHADAVKGKIGENLRAALPRLPLNRELATIKLDVALDRAPTELLLRERHVDELRVLYARYGFKQALRELDGGAAGDDASPGRRRAQHRRRLRARAPCLPRKRPMRRWPRRASTRWCSRASSSTPGSAGCRPPTNSRSTPRPIRSTRCARTWSA